MKRFCIVTLTVLAAGLGSISGGAAQDDGMVRDYPAYAPRCSTTELMQDVGAADPCSPTFAQFGLSGPVALQTGDIDVVSTGSILPRDNVHETGTSPQE